MGGALVVHQNTLSLMYFVLGLQVERDKLQLNLQIVLNAVISLELVSTTKAVLVFDVVALDDVNLAVQEGKFLGV